MTYSPSWNCKCWISPNPWLVANKVSQQGTGPCNLEPLLSVLNHENLEWKNTKSLPNSPNSRQGTHILWTPSALVCDKDIDVSIPGERSVDHPWCKASSGRRHQTLDRKFCSLPKKNTQQCNNTTVCSDFPTKSPALWDAVEDVPKNIWTWTLPTMKTKEPIISTCPNALAHILGTTSLLPSQSPRSPIWFTALIHGDPAWFTWFSKLSSTLWWFMTHLMHCSLGFQIMCEWKGPHASASGQIQMCQREFAPPPQSNENVLFLLAIAFTFINSFHLQKKSKVSPFSHFSQISLYQQLSNEKDNSESHSCLLVD